MNVEVRGVIRSSVMGQMSLIDIPFLDGFPARFVPGACRETRRLRPPRSIVIRISCQSSMSDASSGAEGRNSGSIPRSGGVRDIWDRIGCPGCLM